MDRLALGALSALLLTLAYPSMASSHSWELVGRTYDSVGFINRSRIVSEKGVKLVAVIRISTQPPDDGWKEVEEQLAIDCTTGMIEDRGSTLLDLRDNRESHPGTFKSRVSALSSLYRSLFTAVCKGRAGLKITPEAWLHNHGRTE